MYFDAAYTAPVGAVISENVKGESTETLINRRNNVNGTVFVEH